MTTRDLLTESDDLATALAEQSGTARGDVFYWPTVSGAALGKLISVYDCIERARVALMNGDQDLVRLWIDEAGRTDPRRAKKEKAA
jgi:hypothetical protein